MKCKDCIHFDICEIFYQQYGISKVSPNDCGFAKEKSNFVELPCKVGDTVYVPWKYAFTRGIASVQVEEIKIYDSENHFMFLIDMQSDNEVFNRSFGGWKTDKSIGNTVFLTREEAEKALKESRK